MTTDANGASMGDEYRSRVLVTGGSGFIGRRLVRALVRSGAEVTVADLRAFPDGTVRSVVGDLRDPSVVEAAVSQGTKVIIHLAAVTRVLLSIEDPAGTHALNVDATAGLLEQARLKGVGSFVLASTNAVTGDVGRATITEQIPLRPLTPYGVSGRSGICSVMVARPTSPVTALVEASTKLPTPLSRACSSRPAVASTFSACVPAGSSIDSSTLVTAARWMITFVPWLTAASTTEGSRRSPTTDRTVPSGNARRSATVTSAPLRTRARTSRRPMNPDPPVTSTRERYSSPIEAPFASVVMCPSVVAGCCRGFATFSHPVTLKRGHGIAELSSGRRLHARARRRPADRRASLGRGAWLRCVVRHQQGDSRPQLGRAAVSVSAGRHAPARKAGGCAMLLDRRQLRRNPVGIRDCRATVTGE